MNYSPSIPSAAVSRPAIQTTSAIRLALALIALLAAASPGRAEWSLYQNFQSLPEGYNIADSSDPNENFAVATQDTASSSGSFTVITDPTNSGNQVLKLDAVGYAFSGELVNASTNEPTPILNLTTGTLFYRIYRVDVGGVADINFGAADQGPVTNAVNNANKYQSQLNVSGGTDIFRPRNGGGTVNTGVDWTAGTWFGIYQVIDTTANTSTFYYQGELDASPILMTGSGGTPVNMAFRNGGSRPSTDLAYFLGVNGLPGGGVNDVFYLDDIYVDTAGSNLDGPVAIASVPEPGVTGALAVGLLFGLAAARHRRMHRSL